MSLPCDPWTTADRLCCPDVSDSEDCSGSPIVSTYPWTDDELIEIASRVLFHASCERFPGVCAGHSLRPYRCECRDLDHCGCRLDSIPLAGRYPVLEIDEVKIDGAALPASSYRLDEYSRLVRVDGERWPARQDLSKDPDADADTFIIRFKVGRLVPTDLQYAAALLACELKKACGGQGCSLPDGVSRIIRDGIEYDVVDSLPNKIITSDGLTGIAEVDRILYQYKPCGSRGPKRRLMFADDWDGDRG